MARKRSKSKRTKSRRSHKKLSKGVHCVVLPKIGKRKVKVLSSGKWRFMKGKCK